MCLSKTLQGLLLAVVVATTSGNAKAASSADLELCKTMSGVASSVMEARQAGVRMSRLMEKAAEIGGYWGELMPVFIEEAYKQPAFTSDEDQTAATAEFEDKVYASCLRTRGKK